MFINISRKVKKTFTKQKYIVLFVIIIAFSFRLADKRFNAARHFDNDTHR